MKRTGEKSILDPEIALRIKRLDLRAKLVVEGFMVGYHRSPYHGFSVEFAEHRAYTPGDDIRWLDWRVLARTERLYIRKFEEETNLRAYIVIDTSGSMGFENKLDYAVTLASAFAYILHFQRDAFGLITFSEGINLFLPPHSTTLHRRRFLSMLQSIQAGGKTDTKLIFNKLAENMKKKGLILFLSDFYGDTLGFIRGLKILRRMGNEVIAFQIVAPSEIDLSGKSAIFEDMETGERLQFDPQTMKKTYREILDSYIQEVKTSLRAGLVEYELMTTDTPFDIALMKFLKKREKIR